jgi:hypothetical protein
MPGKLDISQALKEAEQLMSKEGAHGAHIGWQRLHQ